MRKGELTQNFTTRGTGNRAAVGSYKEDSYNIMSQAPDMHTWAK